MPIFHFVCKACGDFTRRLCSPADAKSPGVCAKCGSALVRNPNPPTTQVKEVLDNGVMTKSLERYADAERLYKERSGK